MYRLVTQFDSYKTEARLATPTCCCGAMCCCSSSCCCCCVVTAVTSSVLTARNFSRAAKQYEPSPAQGEELPRKSILPKVLGGLMGPIMIALAIWIIFILLTSNDPVSELSMKIIVNTISCALLLAYFIPLLIFARKWRSIALTILTILLTAVCFVAEGFIYMKILGLI